VEAVPLLARVLAEDPEPLVRAHAAWALRQIDAEKARSALVAALQSETDPVVLTELAGASAD
jgi:epoxyqueuosine reductase